MLDIKFIDDETYPVEASESGDNAFYMNGCDAVGGRPNYAACLAKCAARKKGRLSELYSECSAAIGGKRCPALEMRKQEIAAGKALYFISRPKLKAFNQYRRRMEVEAWTQLSQNGKRIRKPTEDFDQTEVPDDIAPFSAEGIAGFRPSKFREASLADVINSEIGKLATETPAEASQNSPQEDFSKKSTNDAYMSYEGSTDAQGEDLVDEEKTEQVKKAMSEVEAMLPGESPLAYARRIAASKE